MPLNSGTKLGPYEIQSLLGVGGMGEVYRAKDTRLDRTVAVKILPQGVAETPEVRQRFDREARAVSSLNHPHICALYDVGHQDGTDYLVMEFIEGETLAARIANGPLPTADLLRFASQIADALDKAHRQGIVHRDLKPGNVMLTKSGAKLLDFGLAKGGEILQGDIASSPTVSHALTAKGMIVGTMQYMSPEQLEGKEADIRSDIFSFGAVLYEMATGKKAFEAKSQASLIAAILKEDPRPMRELQPMSPLLLERIVKTCLAKDPDERPQSAHDLKLDLDWVRESSGISDAPRVGADQASTRRAYSTKFLIAVVAALVAAISVMLFYWPQKPHLQRMEFAIPVTEEASHIAISADGQMLAFVAPDPESGKPMVNVEKIGSPELMVLAATEGASYPFFSPDGANVAYFADGKLKKISSAGGLPQVLATATAGRGGTWGRHNVIVYAPDATSWIWKVNSDGTGNESFTQSFFTIPLEDSHRWPIFLPDGDRLLFFAGSFANLPDDHNSGIYLTSLSKKDKKQVLIKRTNPGYADGYLFYVDEKGSLRAVSMNAQTGATSGEAEILASRVGYQPSTYFGSFAVAENGTVVYDETVGAALSTMTWYDRSGKQLGTLGDPGVLANPTLSPDGTQVAIDVTDTRANSINVWLADLKKGTSSRFTFDAAEDVAGVWSRDGATIAYRSVPGGTQVYLKQAAGLQNGHSILSAGNASDIVPNSWSLDGKQILCTTLPDVGGSKLEVITTTGGNRKPFLDSKFSSSNGQISPDGKWVAYASNESGDWEIYVTTFPTPGGQWQVSRGGGTEPRWRGDGKEIFYIGAKSTLTAVPVSTQGTFSPGNPTPLFRTQLRAQVSSTDLFSYDVTKDGQRFLINRYIKPAHVAPIHVVLNATANLKK